MAKQSSDVMVARETFATLSDGRAFVVRRKITRLRADDPIVKANASRFELADAGLPTLEQATAAPGEKRGKINPDDLKKDELTALAEDKGVEVAASDTKADIAKKINKA